MASLLGIEYKDLPTVRLLDQRANLKYKYKGNVATMAKKDFQAFIDDYEEMALEPYFRSAPIPTKQKGNVVQVVGDN